MPPIVLVLLLLPLLPLLRILYRLYWLLTHRLPPAPPISDLPIRGRVLCVLGSGGHTAELLSLLGTALPHLNPPPQPLYLCTPCDGASLTRAHAFHEKQPSLKGTPFVPVLVPRPRRVGQAVLSSVWTCLRSLAAVWKVVGETRPHVVVSNGPALGGVAAAVVAARWCVWGERCAVVYVESLARVNTLSLTGKVVYWVADRFVVQWEQLRERYPRALWYGRLS